MTENPRLYALNPPPKLLVRESPFHPGRMQLCLGQVLVRPKRGSLLARNRLSNFQGLLQRLICFTQPVQMSLASSQECHSDRVPERSSVLHAFINPAGRLDSSGFELVDTVVD